MARVTQEATPGRGGSPGAPRASFRSSSSASPGRSFARTGHVTPFMLPPLSAVFTRIWDDALDGRALPQHRADALPRPGRLPDRGSRRHRARRRDVAQPSVRWFFDPIVSVGFPMPKIAFLPIVILWLGFFDVSKIAMVVFDAIFPVVTATIAGHPRRRARADLVGAQHGRQRPRAAVADHAAGGPAADPHRVCRWRCRSP